MGRLTNEKQQVLDNALLWSNEVAQYYVDIFNNSFCKNKQKIHHETYPYIRAKWSNLNSKCVQWIRDKCIASLRPEKTKSIRVPVMADCQSFKVFWKDAVHIKHFKGILRLWRNDFPLILSQWHFDQLDAAKRLLYIEIFKNRKGQWYCHLVGEYEEKPTTGFRMMGVDCGINNVAVTSTNKFFGGKRVVHQRNEFRKHKRKQSGIRLRNYVRDINHKVSRAVVNEAVQQGVSVIRLERLKYYREKQEDKGHALNYKRHSWAYAQLQSFITYKAQLEGIGIEFVNPAFTSQVCSRCGKLGCRAKHKFECPHCGFRCHADLNASRNICKGITLTDGVIESTPPTDAQSVGNPHPLWVG
jgi:IS605 OrfB family transposase